jgi:hypothetical protein
MLIFKNGTVGNSGAFDCYAVIANGHQRHEAKYDSTRQRRVTARLAGTENATLRIR